jgi:alanine racemase
MVRPGTMLYGFYHSPHVNKRRVKLRPAMTLKALVSHVKNVPEGTGISYGLTYRTSSPSVIATIPVGYADGYSRRLSNLGEVAVKGVRAPIIGRVCMDQCMADVTGIQDVSVGDEVTLMGDGLDGSPSVDEMASWLGTIITEVICSISKRVPRVYVKGGEVVGVRDHINP